ncbi:MAG TPA: SulP family inorganic anion transporter, partial [Verrucomicrobiae bacterium]|nr:SulP family inorganic anion transporter [Verrucomicrobiae bacterium]
MSHAPGFDLFDGRPSLCYNPDVPGDSVPENPPRVASGPARPAGARWQQLLPGLALIRNYKWEWLTSDLISGASVCVVMIPSVIAYAGLMGLSPEHGLYAALVPMIAYALLGSSRQMIVGPDIAISLLISSTIAPLAGGDHARAAELAALVAILSGLLLLLAAWAKLGAIADFLSKPVLVGYMTGAALILVASQLNKFLGIDLKNSDFFPRVWELAGRLNTAHWPSFGLGVICLSVLIVLKRLMPRVPGTLVVCVGATLASIQLGLAQKGFAVVGTFPRGLPAFSVPLVDWHLLHSVAPAAIGIALLTYTE